MCIAATKEWEQVEDDIEQCDRAASLAAATSTPLLNKDQNDVQS